MAATHGHLGEFYSTQEECTERLEQYFTASDVRDVGKQRAILLSCCGVSTYRLIKNELAPNRPIDVPFDDIVTQIRTNFQLTPSKTDSTMIPVLFQDLKIRRISVDGCS